jgi:hypothetical protein
MSWSADWRSRSKFALFPQDIVDCRDTLREDTNRFGRIRLKNPRRAKGFEPLRTNCRFYCDVSRNHGKRIERLVRRYVS